MSIDDALDNGVFICQNCGNPRIDCECDIETFNDEPLSDDILETSYDGDGY